MKILKKLKTLFEEGQGYFWLFIILLLFAGTGLDHLVNSTLYQWGLEFGIEWFLAYGAWFTLIFVAITGAIATVYWFSTDDNKRSRFTQFAIVITIMSLWIGGFLDILWFMMSGAFPPFDAVWWWMPFYWLFGIEWTLVHQIIYTTVWFILLIVIWLVDEYLGKEG